MTIILRYIFRSLKYCFFCSERKRAEVKAFELVPQHPNILHFEQAWEEKGHLFIEVSFKKNNFIKN